MQCRDLSCASATRGSGEPGPAPRRSACPPATACTCSSKPSGSALWRFDYILQGRRSTLSFGSYPGVSLTLARPRRAEARVKVAAGINTSRERREAREAAAQAMTFAEVADEWLARQQHVLAPVTFEKASWMLKSLVNPWLGKRPTAEIELPELLSVLRRFESRGKNETAHRTKQRCGQVFRYAIATGRAQRDPSADLRDALTPVRSPHWAAVTHPEQVGELLKAIDGFNGTFLVKSALATGAPRVLAPKRTPEGGVERDRPRSRRVAHPGGAHEDARGAHRAAQHAGRRDPAGGPVAH